MIKMIAMLGMPGMTELLIILGVVLLLFGGKKLPELARGLGGGLREFKNAASDAEAAHDTPPPEQVQSGQK